MEGFFEGLERAIRDRNWHAALVMALTLPDICAKTVVPAGGSQRRYADWFDKHLKDKYTGGAGEHRHAFLTGSDCYALRCALLHEGSADITEQRAQEALERFNFITPGERGNSWHNNKRDGTLVLMVDEFAADFLAGARSWWASLNEEQREEARQRHLKLIDADTLNGI